ncbi:MAG: family 1 glycosylhydrolase [Gemmataceae bacterium]
MPETSRSDRPEVWAGVECTVNRVGDQFFDQMSRSGHDRRADDLDRLAGLGVSAVRYPVLWERHVSEPVDWAWADERLGRLRALGVRPVIGLVHHGSGPPHTSLTDPAFADGLAAFAGRVAERFPWVDAYTPVNEPLTTARFAGLYGHWYPHGRDDRTFVRCLLTQCRATAQAMAAVRRVRPDAALVQTDDLGYTHAAPALAYQAAFDNERRWLSWDLLTGRVSRRHPLWRYLLDSGATEAELGWLRDHPCPPDVIGVNHYLTSERFLDDRLDRYPPAQHGGNSRHRYVDTEAVRVLPEGPLGPAALLRQVWERYRLPVAVTEAHLGCTREEQLRWLADVWRAACRVRVEGADVRAVTVWSAFGAFDWDSLVTRQTGSYEPGAFDVRSDPPRPTAVAALTRDLAAGRDPAHPALDTPGWWRRPERLFDWGPKPEPVNPPPAARPVLITGGAGSLGRAVARVCAARGLSAVVVTRAELDIADPAAVRAALDRVQPWAVVNAAGYVRVDSAERDADRCRRANADGPAVLAAACRSSGVRLVTFSSDLVFDGRAARPYREDDRVAPLSVYGASKAEAERRVLAALPDALVVRTAAFFGPWDGRNFVHQALTALRGGFQFAAADDLTVTPSYLPDLAHAALDLLVDGERGMWHLSNPDAVTWADLARAAAERAGVDPVGVVGRPAAWFGWVAPRPMFSALATARGLTLPPLADSLARFVREADPRPAA